MSIKELFDGSVSNNIYFYEQSDTCDNIAFYEELNCTEIKVQK